MPRDHRTRVVARQDLSPEIFRLDLAAPELARELRPGQFIQIQLTSAGSDPLLRRPFGYLTRYPAAGQISLLVRTVGRGTALLRAARAGDELMALGPLGRGFSLAGRGPVLIVAGGIGLVPLFDLAATLSPEVPVTFVYGARTGQELFFVPQIQEMCAELRLATEDGSLGTRGTVMAPLEDLAPLDYAFYYGCGPRPMLSALQSMMAASGIPGELSVEERMACGFGACLGCAVAIRDYGGGIVFKRACADGPVFPAEAVVFDA